MKMFFRTGVNVPFTLISFTFLLGDITGLEILTFNLSFFYI